MSDEFALQGLPVRSDAGEPVGELERLVVDGDTGKPGAIVVRAPGGDARAVPVEDVAVTEDGLILHSRERTVSHPPPEHGQ